MFKRMIGGMLPVEISRACTSWLITMSGQDGHFTNRLVFVYEGHCSWFVGGEGGDSFKVGVGDGRPCPWGGSVFKYETVLE